MKMRKIITWSIGVAVLAAAAFALNEVRLSVGGIRNMVSLTYWKARINHTDLYAPNARMLKHGSREYKEVAITIDDGPHPASCPTILDILKRENVHVTFFPVGKRIKEHPDLVRRMVAEGNEVGNHTEDHLRLTTLRPDQIEKQLQFCQLNFYRATGRKMYLMRPPGMSFNEEVLDVVKRMGYVMVNWTSAAKDFIGAQHENVVPPDVIADRVMHDVDNGGIILIHDAPDTAQALPMIIQRIKAKGYKFVTIPEMLAHLPSPVYVKSNAGPLPAVAVKKPSGEAGHINGYQYPIYVEKPSGKKPQLKK